MEEPIPPAAPVGPEVTPVALVTQAISLLQAAKVKLQPKPVPTAREQFMHFVRSFRDTPVKNTMIVFGLVTFVVLVNLALSVASRKEREKEMARRESLSYVAQTQALDNVKTSLNSLLDFVQSQKDKLQESEDIVNALKAEQEKLKPVVETDRKVIEAILDLQSQRIQADVWKERAFGFGTGILASIIAAFFLRMFERKKRPLAVPTEDKA